MNTNKKHLFGCGMFVGETHSARIHEEQSGGTLLNCIDLLKSEPSDGHAFNQNRTTLTRTLHQHIVADCDDVAEHVF